MPIEVARLIDAARRYLKTGSFTAEMDLHFALKAIERLPDSYWCYKLPGRAGAAARDSPDAASEPGAGAGLENPCT